MSLTPKQAARILNLDASATLSDVRAARRRLVFAYHPDRFEDAECADRHMARINAAYDTVLAHLQGRPLPSFSHNFSDGTNFKQPKPSQPKSSQRTTAQARKNTGTAGRKAPPRAAPRSHQPRSATPEVIAISAHPAQSDSSMTAASAAKARAASSAYRTVLNDIGGAYSEPQVDTKVLRLRA